MSSKYLGPWMGGWKEGRKEGNDDGKEEGRKVLKIGKVEVRGGGGSGKGLMKEEMAG